MTTTTETRVSIETPAGELVARLYGSPSSVYVERFPDLTPDDPITLHAHVTTGDDAPIELNGVKYRADGHYHRQPDGSWIEDRQNGAYLRLRRHGNGPHGFPLIGDEAEPTPKAREYAYRVLGPAIVAALAALHFDDIDEAHGRALSAYGDSVREIEARAARMLDVLHSRLAAHRVAYSAIVCPREGCGHRRELHTGPGRSCEVARDRESCLCYRFGAWVP